MSPSGNWKLLGRSAAIRSIQDDLERVLPRLAPGPRVPPILLQGETGTGRDMVLTQLGEAHLECGPEESERRASQALELVRGHGERANEAWVMHLLGRVAAARPSAPVDAVIAHFSGAMTLAGELGMRPLVAHCRRDLGRLYRRTGRHPEASEHLATPAAMYEEMDMRFRPEPAVPPSV